MNLLDHVSSGTAAAIGIVSGVPSVAYAVVTEDFGGIVTGTALGIIALGWAIWKSVNDSRINTLRDRIDQAEKEAAEVRDEKTKAEVRSGQLTVENAILKARLRQFDPTIE